jgi:hypothetical protein
VTRNMNDVTTGDLQRWFTHGYMCGLHLADTDPEQGLYMQWQWDYWTAGNRVARYDIGGNIPLPTAPLFDANPTLKAHALIRARAYSKGFKDGHDNNVTDDLLIEIEKGEYRSGWETGAQCAELELITSTIQGLIIPTKKPIRILTDGPTMRQWRNNQEWWDAHWLIPAGWEEIQNKIKSYNFETVPGQFYDLWQAYLHEENVEYLTKWLEKARLDHARNTSSGAKWLAAYDERLVQMLETALGKES